MRLRTALAVAAVAAVTTVAAGRPDGPELLIKGAVEDEVLLAKAPPLGVVVSEKGYADLTKAWGIGTAPKVDFGKTILAVATTRGSQLKVTAKVTDGDLTVLAISTRDLRPGFRYAVVAVPRDGVKTVNGKALPGE